MTDLATAHAPGAPATAAPISVLAIIGSAVLVGIGLLGLAYWLITFRWLYLGGAGVLAVGGYLLFTRATGPDRA